MKNDLFAALLLLAASCGGPRPSGCEAEAPVVLRPERSGGVAPADLIADYRYVPLGDTRQPVGEIDQLLLTDERIIVVDRQRARAVFVFDRDGRLCAEIAAWGRGPQEYASLDHVALVPGRTPQLALVDAHARKALFYDLDGHFLRTVAIPFPFSGLEFLGPDAAIGYADGYTARHDPFFRGRSDAGDLLFFMDGDFRIRRSALPCRTEHREAGYTAPSVRRCGESCLIHPVLCDTIYRADGEMLLPLYRLDLSRLGAARPEPDALSDREIRELGGRVPLFWGDFIPGERFLFFRVSVPPEQENLLFVRSECSGEVLPVLNSVRSGDAALADVAFQTLRTSWRDEFVATIPGFVVPMICRDGTDNPLLRTLGEDSNPVLVFYRLREAG